MKILVTGGVGFIGSHVVDLYIDHGYEVVVVDDLSTGRISNLNPAATFYQLDIRSHQLEEVFIKERPEIVNHHAAQMDVRRSVAEPMFDADVNVLGSLNLIECAKRHRVRRLIYISSGGAVYGEPVYLPCDEAHPINPICQYGASKHTVEHYLYMYQQNYGLAYTVLRYPNVYGPRQDPYGEAGVVAIFTGQMLSSEDVVINGDGEQQRDFVYVADCAQANLLALTSGDGSGIYNLGSGRGTSINEIFATLQAITGFEKDPMHAPPKVGETRRIYLTAEKAQRELGWSPTTSLEIGLEKTVDYFRTSERLIPIRLAPTSVQVEAREGGIVGHSQEAFSQLVGESTGKGIETSRGGSDTKHFPDSLEQLYTFSHELADPPDRNAALQRLLELALGSVGAVSGSVLVLDEDRRIHDGALMYSGQSDGYDPQRLEDTLDRGLAGWVVEHGQAALIPSTCEDSRWLQRSWEVDNGSSRSVISVPLMARDRVVGVLTLAHSEPGRFTEKDLALLVTIAGIVYLKGEKAISVQPPA
ncbi:MAG: NAD-dependent epimerase/dehydratase family protein [Anaerolineales bacterium]|nr:NAD-dependent epimerase/dehydratase family protein [Anaerolineales bacterium]